jgi:hypothetical protein
MGGQLNLVAQFPNRPPFVLEHLGSKPKGQKLTKVSQRRELTS